MTKNNKGSMKYIYILVIIIIVIIGIFLINKKSNKKSEVDIDKNKEQSQMQKEENQESEKYVKVLENGTKLNTSSKLNENKKLGDLEIKDIQLTYKNGVTNLLAVVENTKKEKIQNTPIEIELLDENGKTLYKLQGIIGEVDAGQQSEINCSVTADFVNAYDFRINKK